MLRDITIGQHFPGNSILHTMDPRVKLLLTIAYIVMFVLLMVGVLGGMFAVLANVMCGQLAEMGLDWLYFVIMGMMAVFLGAFGSVFNTYSGLYLAKDNDLLLSMPIPVRIIMASRLLNVYLLGLMYSGIVILPVIIVYWCTVPLTAGMSLGGVVLLIVISLFVLALSCVLGWVVAKISLKLKTKSFITVLVSLVFFGLYYFVCFRSQALIGSLLLNAASVGDKIKGSVYPLYLFGRVGCGDGVAMLIVSAVVIALLALVWYIGTRGASSSANLQTVIAGLIVALIVAIWWVGDIKPANIPFPAPGNIELTGLFAALSVMFWCFVGLEAFAHLASEFKNPERDFPRALMIGLLLAGLVYWGCTVVVLHFDAYGEKMAAAASLPKIVVQLFGVGALWIACVIGYLACFASLNIYIQSFARLVWSQAQHNPDHYLARLSSRHIPNNALNAVLGCCVVSTLVIHALEINLDALIIYANGIFIMIYLLCMLAGCKLLQGRYRLLAVVGGLLCVLLLAMVGWKSLYALIMLAGLWLLLPKRKTPENGITT